MALNLPSPSEAGMGLLQGLDVGSNLMQRYLQNQLNPYRKKLMEAQAQQATGNAATSQMLARILQGALGAGGTSSGLSDVDKQNIDAMHPGDSYVVGGNPSTPGTSNLSNLGINPRDLVASLFGIHPYESPEQKRAGEVSAKGQELENQESIKADKADVDTARTTLGTFKNLSDIADILHNPKNSNLTGMSYALPGGETIARNSKNDEMGKFLSSTGLLQSDAARAEAAGNGRGAGIGLVKFFQSIKPDIKNSPDVNKGMIKQLIGKYADVFDQSKKSWESRNPGKQFPVERPDYESIISNVQKKYAESGTKPGTVKMFKNGVEFHIPKSKSDDALAAGYSYGR